MPWEKLIEQVPALGALCFLVAMGGACFWRMVKRFMDTQDSYMGQIRELSKTCHDSHREVAEITSSAINSNSEQMSKLRDQQHETELVMRGMTLLLKNVNGRLKV